jgi:hypothetical protein
MLHLPPGIQYGGVLATFTQDASNLIKSRNICEHNSAYTEFNCVTSQFLLHVYLAPWHFIQLAFFQLTEEFMTVSISKHLNISLDLNRFSDLSSYSPQL